MEIKNRFSSFKMNEEASTTVEGNRLVDVMVSEATLLRGGDKHINSKPI